jgi:hypothetical protein
MENNYCQVLGNYGTAGSISTSVALYATPKSWKFCPQCGKELKPEWRHCAECGEALNVTSYVPYYPYYPQPWRLGDAYPYWPQITWTTNASVPFNQQFVAIS